MSQETYCGWCSAFTQARHSFKTSQTFQMHVKFMAHNYQLALKKYFKIIFRSFQKYWLFHDGNKSAAIIVVNAKKINKVNILRVTANY